jgi:hypothetical protein
VLFPQLLEFVQHLVGSVFTFELTTTRSLMDSLLLSERSTETLPGHDDWFQSQRQVQPGQPLGKAAAVPPARHVLLAALRSFLRSETRALP